MLDLISSLSGRHRRHLRPGLVLAIAASLSGVWLVVGQAAQSSQSAGSGAPNTGRVTKAQFDEWMTKLSNWGRWGKDDERGALNLITPETRRRAAALVKTGTTVSLSRQIPAEGPGPPGGTPGQPRPINQNGSGANTFLIAGDYLFERQEIEYHGGRLSHFDALCHVSYNGKLYNGLNFKEVVTEARLLEAVSQQRAGRHRHARRAARSSGNAGTSAGRGRLGKKDRHQDRTR